MQKPNKHRIEVLRNKLLTAQAQLTRDKRFALAVVVIGMPTAGRSEIINQFLEWLDPKHIRVHALEKLRARSATRPALWRYWITLPPRGQIAIYFDGWYEEPLTNALYSPKKAARSEARVLERIKQLETMLTLDKIRIVKIDLRVDKKRQKERIAKLRADRATRWRVTKDDRWLAKHYAEVSEVTDRITAETSTPDAPWHVVDGADSQRRAYEAGSHVLQALMQGFKEADRKVPNASWPTPLQGSRAAFPTRPEKSPHDDAYERELEHLQGRLALLSRKREFAEHSVVLAFEGMDAAGKGGTIRRMTYALDARQYQVVPVSAPSADELAHPYLWRFWRRIPDRGEFSIFDRSWYGRVLVERVRDLTPDADWQRAYAEINEFELQLAESNVILHKFWLAVSKEEQLRRLNAREHEPLKRFKLDTEDWANRRYYDAYQTAAMEMIQRTNTAIAPWSVIEADDKKHARLKVLRTVCDTIERALKKSS